MLSSTTSIIHVGHIDIEQQARRTNVSYPFEPGYEPTRPSVDLRMSLPLAWP